MNQAKSPKKNIEDIYPLSPMQQGMLFHYVYNPDSAVYFEQFMVRLRGRFDGDRFRKAWLDVMQRHPVLRTSFVWKKLDKMLQVVHRETPLPFEFMDWRHIPAGEQPQRLENFYREDRQKGFNLAKPPLMRLYLIQLTEDHYQFLWSFHHLLMDGWSLPIVLNEVFTLYESGLRNIPAPLPPSRPFKEYIQWLSAQDLDKARDYWKTLLRGYDTPSYLRPVLQAENFQGENPAFGKVARNLDTETSAALTALARGQHVTMNSIIQLAWSLLISAYTGLDDVVFGATVSGRPPAIPDIQMMVGLFINTLPVRLKIDPDRSLLDLLKAIQAQSIKTRDFEYTSLVDIQSRYGPEENLPLFDSIVVFENYPVDESLSKADTSISFSDISTFERTNYPLTVVAAAREKVFLEISYQSEKIDPRAMEALMDHLENILVRIAEQPQMPVRHLSLLNEKEYRKTVYDLNDSNDAGGEPFFVHKAIEKLARKIPDAPAIIHEDRELSFTELNTRANRLAHLLIKQGIREESFVGIALQRSGDMIVSILAILKAGGAYLPLDPSYPPERLRHIITDSAADIILTHSSVAPGIPATDERLLFLDRLDEELQGCPDTAPPTELSFSNLAYMIYTSGSTGLPKGVMISHGALANYLNWCLKAYPADKGNGSLVHATIAFDATVTSIFPALVSGKPLILTREEDGMEGLSRMLDRHGPFGYVKITPAHLDLLRNQLSARELPQQSHAYVIGGENLLFSQIDFWQKNAPDTRLFNEYGPTENTVGCIVYEAHEDTGKGSVPIGRVIPKTQAYILNEYLNPVPVGVAGELYLAGDSLARGYFNRPDLTAERFLANPFSATPGARMYKTGDKARYNAQGQIVFLGRADDQVKIRGFRIELGEIEHHIKSLPYVRDVLVDVFEPQQGNRQLVAYIIADGTDTLPEAETLGHELQAYLPDYMIPNFVVSLEAFPLTPNGKIDRKALPRPLRDGQKKDKYVPPSNPTEEAIQKIWQELLETEAIGVHENFFHHGGHSILATRLVTRFRQQFDVELPLAAVFEATTIARQALLIEMEKAMARRPQWPPLQKVSRENPLPVSLPQQRLWFIDQFNPGTTAYNIHLALRINGPLNISLIEQSIQAVINRHEILRTSFDNIDGAPFLHIHDQYDFKLEFETADPAEEADTLISKATREMAATVFNLSTLPLMRMKIVRMNENSHLLCGVIHHIISDGLSMGILIKEALENYDALLRGEKPLTEALPFQYADYAHWQRDWLKDEILEQHLSYWKQQIGVRPPVLELPTDFPRPALQTFNGRQFDFDIDEALLSRLNRFSMQNGVTLFMTLMTAWQILLHRYSRQETILVGTPVTGRLLEEANELIGFFVNTLVIKGQFNPQATLTELLTQIRGHVLEAHAHQSLPFEQLVDLLQPDRDLSHPPLFQAAFILQNLQNTEWETAGLRFEEIVPQSVVAKVDISLYASETRDGLRLRLEYNSDLFHEATIGNMARHFNQLLSVMTANPTAKVSRLALMREEEVKGLLAGSGRPADSLPYGNVAAAFASVATGHADHTALSMGGSHISYKELDRLSDHGARQLAEMGVHSGDIVGICMSRSPEMIVAMLSVIKAGAAYLPLDPAYPRERLRYMVEDSAAARILTNEETAKHTRDVFGDSVEQYTMETLLALNRADRKLPSIFPEQAAYVIYTSGSTGKPKGAVLHHRGLLNLANEQKKAFGIDRQSRVLQFASLSFDAATWETFMALLNGATLVLIDPETQASVEKLQDVLVGEKITTVTLPPSVLTLFDDRPMPDLRTIITAGEKCPQTLVKRFQPGRRMVNAYGPTETTVCASLYETDAAEETDPPIGFPLGGFDLHVLDEHLHLLPPGVPGELCIGGVGLARGYLNRPGLTAERFVPHPHGTPGSRLYRSGDLVKRGRDGAIEFLGRIDHQVKLRGFRIELGEIQNSLLEIEGVRDAFVMVREDQPGEPRLTAYVASDGEMKSISVKSVLARQLPEYMIPSAFVFLSQLPLNANGKIDREALPVPELDRTQLSSEFVAPRNEQEETIAGIVRDLLHLEKVGIHDNFFELGGHSLLATRFVARMRESLSVEVPLRLLFENPTIEGIARVLAGPDVRLIDEDEPALEALAREPEEDEQLLETLEGLSEDELDALLNDSDGDEEDDE